MNTDFDRVRELYAQRPTPTRRVGPPREQGSVTDRLRNLIMAEGGYAVKTHGGPLSSGQPDLIGCLRGRSLAIETKRKGARGPTPRQAENLERWGRAGAISFWASDAVEAMARIRSEVDKGVRQEGT